VLVQGFQVPEDTGKLVACNLEFLGNPCVVAFLIATQLLGLAGGEPRISAFMAHLNFQ